MELLVLFSAALAAAQYPARRGLGCIIGPGTSEIIRTETTYTPGPMEKGVPSLLFLWPGIIDNAVWGRGHLIQTVATAHPALRLEYQAKPGRW